MSLGKLEKEATIGMALSGLGKAFASGAGKTSAKLGQKLTRYGEKGKGWSNFKQDVGKVSLGGIGKGISAGYGKARGVLGAAKTNLGIKGAAGVKFGTNKPSTYNMHTMQ